MKKHNQENKFVTWIKAYWWTLVLLLISLLAIADTILNPMVKCHKEEGITITGVKICTVTGGFLGGGISCIYETNKGEIATPTGHSTGDVISGSFVCKEVSP